MGNIEPLRDQAEQYQRMKADLDELLLRISNQTQWFNLLDPRSFGYELSDGSFLIAMVGPEPKHAQHLDYHPRSETVKWDNLSRAYADFQAKLAEGGRDVTRLQERIKLVRYYLQDLEDKLDMLRKLKEIRDIIRRVGAP